MLEGVDKAGKTTQCQKLVQTLRHKGQPAEMMRFPGMAFLTTHLCSVHAYGPYMAVK